jgi:hypothetical protein
MPEQQIEHAVVQIRPRVLNKPAAAAWLGVSITTFDDLRKSVPFRDYMIGGRVVFKVDDLDAYLETVFAEPPTKPSRGRGVRS